ncbi:MAG: bifunctional 5,10-methylene-tetrahydrofolate dehydrogenase/5,10-methylene-tetrahydrofolate [Parcubacteria group bacterium]|nr:bifunctional 5,10-methylene-tetrahydrofolate dehydrogenase/5,10-methylene-tetrahydrofolate [Parcubacteria group bacterium]
MIIDGRKISAEILDEVREHSTGVCVMRAVTVSPTPATVSYLNIKRRAAESAGMELEVVELPENATTKEVIAAVLAPGADAVIVQLPLPAHLDEAEILQSVPTEKDADVLSPFTRERGTILPPVAAAVDEILMRADIHPEGKRVVIIGKGRLVGEPVAARLAERGAHVTSYDSHTFTSEVLKDADIIVSGAGVPHLITPGMLTQGVVLIDAATSEQVTEHGSAVVGDIDPACEPLASVYTPVPGGVGPITVACLFRNVAQLRKANIKVD